jgi:hypothetical protein
MTDARDPFQFVLDDPVAPIQQTEIPNDPLAAPTGERRFTITGADPLADTAPSSRTVPTQETLDVVDAEAFSTPLFQGTSMRTVSDYIAARNGSEKPEEFDSQFVKDFAQLSVGDRQFSSAAARGAAIDLAEAQARRQYMPQLQRAVADHQARAEAMSTPEGAAQVERAEDITATSQAIGRIKSGFLDGLAGTTDAANFLISGIFNTDEETFLDNEFLNDVSSTLRVNADTVRDQTTSKVFESVQNDITALWQDETTGAGTKLVNTVARVFDDGGGNYLSALAAESGGQIISALLTGGGATGAARLGARGVATLTPRTAAGVTNLSGKVAAAANVTAVGRFALRTTTALPAAVPLGVTTSVFGTTVREVADQFEDLTFAQLQGPGWEDAKTMLQRRDGVEPTNEQIKAAMAKRAATTSGALSAGVTLAATLLAPGTEGALTKIISLGRVQANTSLAGGVARRAIVGGASEGVAEGAEEFIQTVAPGVGQRVVVDGTDPLAAIAAENGPDAQMAATLGAILGVGLGGAVGAGSPRAEGDADADTGAESADLEGAAAGRDVGNRRPVHNLLADFGVQVSADAVVGDGDARHGEFSSPRGDAVGQDFTTFFSDGERALAIRPTDGRVAYGTQENGTIMWSTETADAELRNAERDILVASSTLVPGDDGLMTQALFAYDDAGRNATTGAGQNSDPLAATPDTAVDDAQDVGEEAEQQAKVLNETTVRGSGSPEAAGISVVSEDPAYSAAGVQSASATSAVALATASVNISARTSSVDAMADAMRVRLMSAQADPDATVASGALRDFLTTFTAAANPAQKQAVIDAFSDADQQSPLMRDARREAVTMLEEQLAADRQYMALQEIADTALARTVGATAQPGRADPLAAPETSSTVEPADATGTATEPVVAVQAQQTPVDVMSEQGPEGLEYAIKAQAFTNADATPKQANVTPKTRITVGKDALTAYAQVQRQAVIQRVAAEGTTPLTEEQIAQYDGTVRRLRQAYIAKRVLDIVEVTNVPDPSVAALEHDLRGLFDVNETDLRADIEQALEMDRETIASVHASADAQAAEMRTSLGITEFENPVSKADLDQLLATMNTRHAKKGVEFLSFETQADVRAWAEETGVEYNPLSGANAFYVRRTSANQGAKHKIALVRNRVADVEMANTLINHEFVVHYGMAKLYGQDGLREIAANVLNSKNPGIKKFVSQVKSRIINERVAHERASLRAAGHTIPDNLRKQHRRALEKDQYQSLLGEEVLAIAAERFADKDPVRKSLARRVLRKFSEVLFGQSGLEVRDMDDMRNLVIWSGRAVNGTGSPNLDYRLHKRVTSTVEGLFRLTPTERAYGAVFNEEQGFHLLSRAADLFGRGPQGRELLDRSQRTNGLARTYAQTNIDNNLNPLAKKVATAHRKSGLGRDEFRHLFSQYAYLKHAEERVRALVIFKGSLGDPTNLDFRNDMLDQIRAAQSDAEVQQLSATMVARLETDPEVVSRLADEDGSTWVNQVGRSRDTVMDEIAELKSDGTWQTFEALNIYGPDGEMFRAGEAMLDMKRNGSFGNPGYNLAKAYNWQHYVPMKDFLLDDDGKPVANADTFAVQSDFSAGAFARAATRGTNIAQFADVLQLMDGENSRYANEQAVNELNRTFAELITQPGEDGRVVLEGFEPMVAGINSGLAFDEANKAIGKARRDAGDDARVITAWAEDGTATVVQLKDQVVANAFAARTRTDFDNTQPIGRLAKALQTGNRRFGKMLTVYSPQFVMFRQLPRDIAQAVAVSGLEQGLGAAATARVAANSIRYAGEMVRFFSLDGVGRERLLEKYREPGHRMNNFASRVDAGAVPFFDQQFLDPSDPEAAVGSLDGVVSERQRQQLEAADRKVQALSNAFDNATRQSLYDEIVRFEQAKSADDRLPRDQIEIRARDVSTNFMNFGQRSSVGRTLSVFMPFAQTALTSTDALLTRRIWSGGAAPVQTIQNPDGTLSTTLDRREMLSQLNYPLMGVLGGIGFASVTAALSVLSLDDEGDSQKAALRPLDFMRSYFLPAPANGEHGDTPIQVSVQPGLMSAIHATSTAAALIHHGYDAGDVGRAWRDMMMFSLTPFNGAMGETMDGRAWMEMVTPSVLLPLYQAASNENAFGGRVFADRDRDGSAEGSETFAPAVSFPRMYIDMAEQVNELTGYDMSPEMLRHWLRSYGGGLGQTIDRTGKQLDRIASGEPADTGDAMLRWAGIVPGTPDYVPVRQFYELGEAAYTPLRQAYNTAQIADRRDNGVNNSGLKWSEAKGHGPAVRAFQEKYGLANIASISKLYNGIGNAIAKDKVAYDIAIRNPNPEQPLAAVEAKARIDQEYRSRYQGLLEAFAQAGIEVPLQ